MTDKETKARPKDSEDKEGCYCDPNYLAQERAPRKHEGEKKGKSRPSSPLPPPPVSDPSDVIYEDKKRKKKKSPERKAKKKSPTRKQEKEGGKKKEQQPVHPPLVGERGDAKLKKGRVKKKVKSETTSVSETSSDVPPPPVLRSSHRGRRSSQASPTRNSPPILGCYSPEDFQRQRPEYYLPSDVEEKCVPLYVGSPNSPPTRLPIIIPVCTRKQDISKNKTRINPPTRQYLDEAGTQYPSAPPAGVSFSNQVPEPLKVKDQSDQTGGKSNMDSYEQQTQAPSAHDAYMETTSSAHVPEAPCRKDRFDYDTTTNFETTEFTDPICVDSNAFRNSKFSLDACQLIRRLATLEEKEKRRQEIENRRDSLPEVNNSNPFIHPPCKPCVDAVRRKAEIVPEMQPKYVSPQAEQYPQLIPCPKLQRKQFKSSLARQPRYSAESADNNYSRYREVYSPNQMLPIKSNDLSCPPCIVFKPIECPAYAKPAVRVSSPMKIPSTAPAVGPQESSIPTVVPSDYPHESKYDTMSSDRSQPSRISPPSQLSQLSQPKPPDYKRCDMGDGYPCPGLKVSLDESGVPKETVLIKLMPRKKTSCCLKRRSSRDGSAHGMRSEGFLGLTEITEGTRIWRMVFAEFLGTFLLVFLGCGAILKFQDAPTTIEIALAFGLLVGSIVQCICHISGGHINPAVSISFFVVCEMKLLRTLLYIIAQLLGAAAAAALLMVATPDDLEGNLGTTGVSMVNPEQAFLYEVVMTFLLIFVIHAVVDPRRKDVKGSAPLAIGLAVGACHLSGIKFSGASMNPARSFGPALVANSWSNHWIYWAGPILGACLAAVIYKFLFKVRKNEDESYDF